MAERKRRERVRRSNTTFMAPNLRAPRCSPRAGLRAALAIGLLVLAALAFSVAPAMAALDHSGAPELEFSAAPECERTTDVAVDETNGYIYVVCRRATSEYPFFKSTIKRFHLNGTPADFELSAPYIEGNTLISAPGHPQGLFGPDPHIAVSNANAPNRGFLYTVEGTSNDSRSKLEIFEPSGKYIPGPPANFGGGCIHPPGREDVIVDPATGDVLTTFIGVVEKLNLGLTEVARLYPKTIEGDTKSLAIDSTGSIWYESASFPNQINKYESDQFYDKKPFPECDAPDALLEFVKGEPSPLFSDPFLTMSQESQGLIAVDPNNDDLYVNRVDHIEVFSPGTASEPPHHVVPSFGSSLTASQGIDVTKDNRVYASQGGGKVAVFAPGHILPDIKTPVPQVDNIGHTAATLTGDIELSGGPGVTACRIEIGTSTAYGTEVPCSPASFNQDEEVTAGPSSLTEGATYHYRFKVTTANGTNVGLDRAFTPAYVLKVKTLAATNVDERGAELHGSLDPDNTPTTYYYQYGPTTSYGLKTPEQSLSDSSAGVKAVSATLSSLPAGKTFHYRLVATNTNGTTFGPDLTFRTASPPDIGGIYADELTVSSATLHAHIDPIGYNTEYHFEYGTTPEYGTSIPLPGTPATQIGSGPAAVDVSRKIKDLQPGFTYHFRVVATNEWGSSASHDVTFDFSPPSCPNEFVRQQTRSTYLPDCRAYELVSPGVAGPVQLSPGAAISNKVGFRFWTQNTGRASSPARFTFWGHLGAINGLEAQNTLGSWDLYMAKRTNEGWVTTLPGLKRSEALQGARHECSESMELCIDHDEGCTGLCEPDVPAYSAPYLFNAAGENLGLLPSNIHVIPSEETAQHEGIGGLYFVGQQRMSPDFNHFIFSSTNVPFAPGGLTGGVGSAYDNDRVQRTVALVSKLPGGGDIPVGGRVEPIDFPGVSTDGSHILMQTFATSAPDARCISTCA